MIPGDRIALAGLMLGLISSPGLGLAYDVRTHGEITRTAFERSKGVAGYLKATGLRAADTFSLIDRTPPDKLADFVNTGTLRDWMIEGVIREDDGRRHPGLQAMGCVLPVTSPSPIDRSLNHFFDVQRGGRGVTVLGVTLGFPAPDWALGRQGRGPNPDQNQFSLPDARDYQIKSLTEATGDERDRNTARLFRALGQVAHLLEDVAAPQHTRNDPHAGCVDIITGEHSWFEEYVETRALGAPFRRRGEVSPPLQLDGYDAVAARPYQEFFTNESRQGLADLSSRNFLSAGTNLSSLFGNCGGLSEPVCEPAAYKQELRGFRLQAINGTTISGIVTLYTRDTPDPLTGTTIPAVPVSTRSMWDQHLENQGLLEVFSLNTFNYDAAADILIPRAVGYVAGLLDTFFRGELAVRTEYLVGEDGNFVSDDRNNIVFGFRIINRTPGEAMDGTFTLHYDTADGTRVEVGRWARTLEPGAESDPLPLPSPLPGKSPAEPGRYLLVFQGRLGDEPGAVTARWVGLAIHELFYDSREPGYLFLDQPGTTIGLWRWEDQGVALFFGQTLRERIVWGIHVYRSSEAVPGDVAAVLAKGFCETQLEEGHGTTGAGFPVTAQLVAFKEPRDLADLEQYTSGSLPPIDRVLLEFTEYSAPWLPGGTQAEINMQGVKFLGIRHVTPPPQPPALSVEPSPYLWAYANGQCETWVTITFQPAPPTR